VNGLAHEIEESGIDLGIGVITEKMGTEVTTIKIVIVIVVDIVEMLYHTIHMWTAVEIVDLMFTNHGNILIEIVEVGDHEIGVNDDDFSFAKRKVFIRLGYILYRLFCRSK